MWETLKRCRVEKSVKVLKHSNVVGYTTLVTILPSVKSPLSRSSQFLQLLYEFFLLSLGYFRSFPELTDFQNMPKVKTFQKNYCWKISEKHLSPQIWYHLLYAYTQNCYFVADLENVCVPIFVRKTQFRLPFKSVTPVVMVGPGTGFAPFRGFIQDRHVQKQNGQ